MILLLPPATFRLVAYFELPRVLFMVMFWAAILSLVAYDWHRLRRLHPATLGILAIAAGAYALLTILPRWTVWVELVESAGSAVGA